MIKLDSGEWLQMSYIFHFNPKNCMVTSVGGAVVQLTNHDSKRVAKFLDAQLEAVKKQKDLQNSGLVVPR